MGTLALFMLFVFVVAVGFEIHERRKFHRKLKALDALKRDWFTK
jgi:hypothetical protein